MTGRALKNLNQTGRKGSESFVGSGRCSVFQDCGASVQDISGHSETPLVILCDGICRILIFLFLIKPSDMLGNRDHISSV